MVLYGISREWPFAVPHEALQHPGFKTFDEGAGSDLPNRSQTQISFHERTDQVPYLLHFLLAGCRPERVVGVEYLENRVCPSCHSAPPRSRVVATAREHRQQGLSSRKGSWPQTTPGIASNVRSGRRRSLARLQTETISPQQNNPVSGLRTNSNELIS